ncbi:MAG: MFS transporter, partial [Muribaculaceae bacterium]|nr:MFS transporter [Muribaculaceae bacterium]
NEASSLRFQYNAMQLLCCGIVCVVTGIYTFSIPRIKDGYVRKEEGEHHIGFRESLRIMFGTKGMTTFLVFVIFSGVCLQISNGYATPFITHFMGIEEYSRSLASENATMLFSLSQISEAACILLVGFMLGNAGIRGVYALGLLAWSLRFLMFGFGNPSGGVWLLVGSMIMYGIAFNFITIAGHIHIQKISPEGMKGFAQGLMMFMSNGIGATSGTLCAGAIVNHWCRWEMVTSEATGKTMRLFMGEWEWPWLIFSAYSFVIMLLWLMTFREKRNRISTGNMP